MPDPLFPSLYGDSQGDPQATQSEDITDKVLPPLSEPGQDFPLSDAAKDVSHLSAIPNYNPAPETPPAGPPQAVQVDPTPQPPAGRPRRSAQDRISMITRQLHDEREARSVEQQQLDQAMQIVNQQAAQLRELTDYARRTPLNPQAPDPSIGDPLPPGAPLTPGTATFTPNPLTRDDVAAVVREAIEGERTRQETATNQYLRLQRAHEVAYQRAVEDYPELGDPNSPVKRTFDQVWARSPLQELDDGPLHVAYQVRGLLAADSGAPTEQRRLQSNIVGPAPTATDAIGEGDRAAALQEYQRLSQRMRAGDQDQDMVFRFRKLARALGRTQPRGTV